LDLALTDGDANIRLTAVQLLDRFKDQLSDKQRVNIMAVTENWSEAIQIGPIAIEELLKAVKKGKKGAEEPLEKIMSQVDLPQQAVIAVTLKNWNRAFSIGAQAIQPLLDDLRIDRLSSPRRAEKPLMQITSSLTKQDFNGTNFESLVLQP